VDGRVQRDENGKEVRFPVLLTPEEKEIARQARPYAAPHLTST